MKLLISIFLFIFSALPAYADDTEVGNVDNFGEYVSNIWEIGSQIIFGISVLMIIIGGIIMMFGGNDEKNINIGKSVIKGSLIASILVSVSAVLIRFLKKPTDQIESPTINDTTLVIDNIISLLLGSVGAIAVLALVYNGYIMMFSGDDTDKLDKAKKGAFFAIIGLITTISAFAIFRFVINPLS